MPDDIDVIFVIYVIYDIYDMYGALTHTICIYVNMGVKRSVILAETKLQHEGGIAHPTILVTRTQEGGFIWYMV